MSSFSEQLAELVARRAQLVAELAEIDAELAPVRARKERSDKGKPRKNGNGGE